MTKAQIRSAAELRELHDAYDKHELVEVGRAQWHNTPEPIFACACGGVFQCLDDEGDLAPYQDCCCDEWVERSYHALTRKWKPMFKAYLRAGKWRPQSKAAARLIYGKLGTRHFETLTATGELP